MIDRKITPILKHRLTQYASVVLVGPRQAGKTTLARSLGAITVIWSRNPKDFGWICSFRN